MKRKVYAFLLITFLIESLILSCAARSIQNKNEIGDISSGKNVLIVAQSSKFKDEVFKKVIDELKKMDCYIKIINLDELECESIKDYEAVILVNTKMVFGIDVRVTDFIKNTEHKEKVILFITEAGNYRVLDKYEEIDAVSSPSRKENVDSVVEFIVQQVKARL